MKLIIFHGSMDIYIPVSSVLEMYIQIFGHFLTYFCLTVAGFKKKKIFVFKSINSFSITNIVFQLWYIFCFLNIFLKDQVFYFSEFQFINFFMLLLSHLRNLRLSEDCKDFLSNFKFYSL